MGKARYTKRKAKDLSLATLSIHETEDSESSSDDDPRTLSEMIMRLPKARFEKMAASWSKTPNLAEKSMRMMLLNEEREWEERMRLEVLRAGNEGKQTALDTISANAGRMSCTMCGKYGHPEKDCWVTHPQGAPHRLRKKWALEKRKELRSAWESDAPDVQRVQSEQTKNAKPGKRQSRKAGIIRPSSSQGEAAHQV